MNAGAFLLLAIAMVVAVADWLAVSRHMRSLEYVLKPLTMVMLVGVALALTPTSDLARVAIIVGLVLSMAGDIFLMLPTDLFVPGLAAFLLAHVAYIVALLALGPSLGGVLLGVVIVAVGAVVVGRRVVAGAGAADAALRLPVIAYMGAISTMVALAFGTGRVMAIAGALLFFTSDAVLGWTRFVADFPRSRVVVMTTYHLGQIGLVLALI